MDFYHINYCYIGCICQILDNNQVKYQHYHTWFRLFLGDDVYSITAVKHNKDHEIVVYKGDNISWCRNTKATIVFQGSLENFNNWLQSSALGKIKI